MIDLIKELLAIRYLEIDIYPDKLTGDCWVAFLDSMLNYADGFGWTLYSNSAFMDFEQFRVNYPYEKWAWKSIVTTNCDSETLYKSYRVSEHSIKVLKENSIGIRELESKGIQDLCFMKNGKLFFASTTHEEDYCINFYKTIESNEERIKFLRESRLAEVANLWILNE